MNVFDFDKTIYNGDSTLNFYLFCLKKKPILVLCIFQQLFAAGLYLANIYSKTKFKEKFFCFLNYIDNIDDYVTEFWQLEKDNICNWYLEIRKNDDVIISASPAFLVEKEAEYLKIHTVIASKVDKKCGKYYGENCYGEEKSRRFYEKFPNHQIENFYSDSLSDEPLAKISENAYIVENEKIYAWYTRKKSTSLIKKIINLFRYGFWGCVTTAINLLIFFIFLRLHMNYILGNVISYGIAIVISYIFNKKFVFETSEKNTHNDETIQIIKYFVVRILSISIDSGLLWVFVEIAHVKVYMSKIIVIVLVILLTYLVNKCFVFKIK